MGRNIKAQVTLEYVFVLALGVVFFMFIFSFFSQHFSGFNNEKKIDEIVSLSESLKIEIDTAVSVHDGYNRSFFIPEKIMGKTYTATINGFELTVKQDKFEHTVFVPNVIGNFTPGQINTIVKEKGVVKIL